MARIDRTRILPNDGIDATDLNDRFSDYSQAGQLNQFNVRDAALDLPQMQTDWFASAIYEHTLGQASLLHSSFVTVNALTSDGAGHVIQDFGGTPSVLSFGLLGQSITTADIFRVYWDLSCEITYESSPWTNAGSISSYTVFNVPKTGTTTIATSATVWVVYLEWDITSNALTNFVAVPGQSDFRTLITGAIRGNALVSCGATTVIPAWVQACTNAQSGGLNHTDLLNQKMGWAGVSGAWHYSGAADGAVTVYGLRWVVRGLLHPYKFGGTNYLAHDYSAAAGVSLRYTSGKAQVLVHRVS